MSKPEIPKVSPRQTLRVSQTSGVIENAYFRLGEEQGIYDEAGLDVEWVDLNSGTLQVKALVSGEVDFADMGVNAALSSIEGGAPIRIIAGTRPGSNFFFYVRSQYNSLEELYGKPIGFNGYGALQHRMILSLYEKYNLDTSRLEFVDIGSSPAIFQALLGGKIDAGASTWDFLPVAEQDGGVKSLYYFGEELPLFIRNGLVVRESDLKDRGDFLFAALTAYVRSMRYSLEHGSEVIKYAIDVMAKDPPAAEFGHQMELKYRVLGADMMLRDEAIEFMQKENIISGAQTQVLPKSQVVDFSIAERVLQVLGPFQWPAA